MYMKVEFIMNLLQKPFIVCNKQKIQNWLMSNFIQKIEKGGLLRESLIEIIFEQNLLASKLQRFLHNKSYNSILF